MEIGSRRCNLVQKMPTGPKEDNCRRLGPTQPVLKTEHGRTKFADIGKIISSLWQKEKGKNTYIQICIYIYIYIYVINNNKKDRKNPEKKRKKEIVIKNIRKNVKKRSSKD